MKMTHIETTEKLITELWRKSKKLAKALDAEDTTIETLLRIIAEGRSWACERCGRELREGIREQAIQDFVRLELDKWGFVNPRGLYKYWGHFVRNVIYHYSRERDGGPMGDGRYFCGITCEQAERDAQELMTRTSGDFAGIVVGKTMGDYGWCHFHRMPIDEDVAADKAYRCLDCHHLHRAYDVKWFGVGEYATEYNVSVWKVRQMIKSGELDARLMDRTRAPSHIVRSIFPLYKWFIIRKEARVNA